MLLEDTPNEIPHPAQPRTAVIYNRQTLCIRGNAAENGRLGRCFRRRSHIPVRNASPAALTNLPHTCHSAASPSLFLQKLTLLPPPPPPGAPGDPFFRPTNPPRPSMQQFCPFVHGRAKTGSSRIMAVSRVLFLERTPSFLLAQTLYRVRSLPSACPSHRDY
jgi:hypothetical protein